MKFKALAPDGAYSDSPYGKGIDGYKESDDLGRPEQQSGKARFLRDAAVIMRQTGKILAEKGLSKSEVRTNRAGIACSGEVSGEFWSEQDPLRRVWVEIGTICLGMLSGRADGACILARTQRYKEEGKRLSMEPPGQNQWLTPAFNSQELAERVLDIYRKGSSEVRICTRKAEPIVLPGPFVHNRQEEEELVMSYQRANEVMTEDNVSAVPMAVPAGQIALL